MGVLEHVDFRMVVTLGGMFLGFVISVYVMKATMGLKIKHNEEGVKRNDGHAKELYAKTAELETHKLSTGAFKDWKDDNKEDMREITRALGKVDDKLDKVLMNGRAKP